MTYREIIMAQSKKPLAVALGAAFLATSIAPLASAEFNPFSAQQLSGGYAVKVSAATRKPKAKAAAVATRPKAKAAAVATRPKVKVAAVATRPKVKAAAVATRKPPVKANAARVSAAVLNA